MEVEYLTDEDSRPCLVNQVLDRQKLLADVQSVEPPDKQRLLEGSDLH